MGDRFYSNFKRRTKVKYSEKDQLERMTSKELVALFNTMVDSPIKRFKDRPTAIRRIIGLLPMDAEEKVTGKPVDKKTKEAVEPKKTKKSGTIGVLTKENPKRKGSQSYDRFELYTKYPIVKDFLANGGKTADLNWDVKHEFILIVEGE